MIRHTRFDCDWSSDVCSSDLCTSSDLWLARWLPRLRVCFSRPVLVASIGLFAAYALVAWTKWPELVHALAALTRPAGYTVGRFLGFWTTGMVVILGRALGHAVTGQC